MGLAFTLIFVLAFTLVAAFGFAAAFDFFTATLAFGFALVGAAFFFAFTAGFVLAGAAFGLALADLTPVTANAAFTTFAAASAMLLPEIIGKPESASIFLPRSTLVPSRRTTSGTVKWT